MYMNSFIAIVMANNNKELYYEKFIDIKKYIDIILNDWKALN